MQPQRKRCLGVEVGQAGVFFFFFFFCAGHHTAARCLSLAPRIPPRPLLSLLLRRMCSFWSSAKEAQPAQAQGCFLPPAPNAVFSCTRTEGAHVVCLRPLLLSWAGAGWHLPALRWSCPCCAPTFGVGPASLVMPARRLCRLEEEVTSRPVPLEGADESTESTESIA